MGLFVRDGCKGWATDSIGINEMIRGLEARGIAATTTSGIVTAN